MVSVPRYKPRKKRRGRGLNPILKPAVGRGRELKFRDNAWAVTPISLTPGFHHFSDMPGGPGRDRRIGRKATVTSISIRYDLELQPREDTGFMQDQDLIRVMLFVDHQANGAFPAITDILEVGSTNSHRNLTNVGRFTILMDRVHPVINGSNAGDGTKNQYGLAIRHYEFARKLKVPLLFGGTSGDIAGMASNAVCGVVFNTISGTGVHLHSVVRLRYSDS